MTTPPRRSWAHHVKIGKEFGVTDDDITAMMAETEGKPSKLEPLAKAILRGAREMVRELAMSDATFAEIKQSLSNEHMTLLLRRGSRAGDDEDGQ